MKTALKLTIFPLVVLLVAFNIGTVRKKLVVIDAAHGGLETGVMYDSIQEKEIVLNIAKYLDGMDTENIEFVTIRSNDDYIPLNERIEKINELKPDLVISFHLAQDADVRKKGATAYVFDNSYVDQSKEYAERILSELAADSFSVNKEIQSSDFYLIKKLENTPALVLDFGYLSNTDDRNTVKRPENQKKMAASIVHALSELN